ncbi:hypothetical protein [Natronorubrum sp. DTA7]|uniref:hypothetical protein n=1 Tax=Natronorubrum sp. DTA7 TaxID=3447016 RepID=UPI003F87A2AD
MDDQTVTRSVPRSVGLLGTLTIAALVALGLWGFADSYLIESGDYLAPTIGVFIATVVFIGALVVLGARSKEWLEGPYW